MHFKIKGELYSFVKERVTENTPLIAGQYLAIKEKVEFVYVINNIHSNGDITINALKIEHSPYVYSDIMTVEDNFVLSGNGARISKSYFIYNNFVYLLNKTKTSYASLKEVKNL